MANHSVTLGELRRRVARQLGFSTTSSDWSAEEIAKLADIVKTGERIFYLEAEHDWSFLRKQHSFVATVANNWYDLPADFVRITSVLGGGVPLAFEPESNLRLRIANENTAGTPRFAAIRIKPSSSGLIYQVGVYPVNATAVTVTLWYLVDPPAMDSDADIPHGGPDHADTLVWACLSAAALQEDIDAESGAGQPKGPDTAIQIYQAKLAASIMRDQKLMGAV